MTSPQSAEQKKQVSYPLMILVMIVALAIPCYSLYKTVADEHAQAEKNHARMIDLERQLDQEHVTQNMLRLQLDMERQHPSQHPPTIIVSPRGLD